MWQCAELTAFDMNPIRRKEVDNFLIQLNRYFYNKNILRLFIINFSIINLDKNIVIFKKNVYL